jgi:hypothetical protein
LVCRSKKNLATRLSCQSEHAAKFRMLIHRATRLGEFSPNGRLFTGMIRNK